VASSTAGRANAGLCPGSSYHSSAPIAARSIAMSVSVRLSVCARFQEAMTVTHLASLRSANVELIRCNIEMMIKPRWSTYIILTEVGDAVKLGR